MKGWQKIMRWFWRVVAVVIFFIIAIPVLVYLPPFQTLLKDYALKIVKEETGMEVSADYFRLKFPLKLELKNVVALNPGGLDTLLSAHSLGLKVEPLPLLKGKVDVDGIALNSVFFQSGTPDSITHLRTRIDNIDFNKVDVKLSESTINVDKARISGVDVKLVMKKDTVPQPPDSTKVLPWVIKARDLEINDVTYSMSMLPTVDSLVAQVKSVRLLNTLVDMPHTSITSRKVSLSGAQVAYILPSPHYLAAHPELLIEVPDSTIGPPQVWSIGIDTIALTAPNILYATAGTVPQPGIDMNYLRLYDLNLSINDFKMHGSDITVPLKRLAVKERSGLAVNASGVVRLDSAGIGASNFNLATDKSTIVIKEASMGMGDLATDPNLPITLKMNARISPADVIKAIPSMRSTLKEIANTGDILADINVTGSPRRLNVGKIDIKAAGLLHLAAHGTVADITNPDRISGRIKLDGAVTNSRRLQAVLPQGFLPPSLRIPDLTLDGSIDYNPGKISGDLFATTPDGSLALDGRWLKRSESYDADLKLVDFPVDAFLPDPGVGAVTADISIHGAGYDPLSPKTAADVDINIANLVYKGDAIRDISVKANIADGHARGVIDSRSPDADLTMNFFGEASNNDYTWDIDGDIRNLNLKNLHLSETTNYGSLTIASHGTYNKGTGDIDGVLSVGDLNWELPDLDLLTPSLNASLNATQKDVELRLDNGDLHLKLAALAPLDSLLAGFSEAGVVVDSIVAQRRFNARKLQAALPPLDLNITMGSRNLLSQILLDNDLQMSGLSLTVHNDSLLSANARISDFLTDTTQFDSITFNAYQRGANLIYSAAVDNRPGTLDNFAHIKINGFVCDNRFSALLDQHDINGRQGFNLGLLANLQDSVVTAQLVPFTPTISYRKWTLNPDNFISYNLGNNSLRANLRLTDNRSSIKIYSGDFAENSSADELIVQLEKINLADWLSVSPFSPPIKGELSANIHVNHVDSVKSLTGYGSVDLENFYYGRKRVGSFNLNLDTNLDPATGILHAKVDMMVDSVPTLSLNGILNDPEQESPLKLDLSIIKLPLRIINPFLPEDLATVDGTLNGKMVVSEKNGTPMLNGYVSFDSTTVKIKMLGTPLRFSDEEIPVRDNVITFDDFTVTAANENPLYINGNVNLSNPANMALNLNLYAHDMQVVNASRPRGADIYGKAFLDINASLRGNSRFMIAKAMVDILPGSNFTYVIPTATSALTTQSSSDMVKFVQFNDTTAVVKADSIQQQLSAMLIDATLVVSEGSTINVDLSTNGNDKVSISGNANLNYTSSPVNDGRLVGRLNINSGFVRYTPPLMSEKLFNFDSGSYIAFTGNMMNPTLNLHAYDKVKANVTQAGENSRLVNFDVLLSVTNTLENMNVKFDLSTDDDITVSNELASMSPDQRANQAMNLLLYGIYEGAGTKGNANISGNLLFSFLESQLNTWMANNVKGVDISFGINQYDRTFNGSTSLATNYSYHVSKTLFNDRFKIIVGGTYSTADDNDENAAMGLINDISAEYMLNRSGSMYIKIFRHVGFESILEGEITQTGVGFVYKRRLRSLRDMFRFGNSGPVIQDHDDIPSSSSTDSHH